MAHRIDSKLLFVIVTCDQCGNRILSRHVMSAVLEKSVMRWLDKGLYLLHYYYGMMCMRCQSEIL